MNTIFTIFPQQVGAFNKEKPLRILCNIYFTSISKLCHTNIVVSPVTRVVPLPLPHDVDVLVIHREAVSIAAVGRTCTQHTS